MLRFKTYRTNSERRTGTHEIGIPHSNDGSDRDLPQQQTILPPPSKLNELDVLFFEMSSERCVDSCAEFFHSSDLTLNAWLSVDVVVLNAIE